MQYSFLVDTEVISDIASEEDAMTQAIHSDWFAMLKRIRRDGLFWATLTVLGVAGYLYIFT
jgi:hypothetical protein